MGSYLITLTGRAHAEKICPIWSPVGERAIATTFTSGYHLTANRAKQLKQAGLMPYESASTVPSKRATGAGRSGVYRDALDGVRTRGSRPPGRPLHGDFPTTLTT